MPLTVHDLMLLVKRRLFGDWRYVADHKMWAQFESDGWHKREDCYAQQLVQMDIMAVLAQSIPDVELIKVGERAKMLSVRTRNDAVNYISHQPDVLTMGRHWNAHATLRGVPNGIVDIASGTLRSADRVVYIDRRLGMAPRAMPTPRWDMFMEALCSERSAEGDAWLARPLWQDFLQRYFGMCLGIGTRDHRFLAMVGRGRNGKSVFAGMMYRAFNEYADVLPESAISKKGTPAGRSKVEHALLCLVHEPSRNVPLDEGFIKSVTGGDRVSIRELYQEPRTVTPHANLLFIANSPPTFQDQAMVARMVLMQCLREIPEAEQNKYLEQEVWEAEGAGIMQWLLDGYALWAEDGLRVPPENTAAVQEMRDEGDLLLQWINDRCVVDVHVSTRENDLYANFTDYCEGNNVRPWRRPWFRRELRQHDQRWNPWRSHRGADRRAGMANVWMVTGLRLRADAEVGTEEDYEHAANS